MSIPDRAKMFALRQHIVETVDRVPLDLVTGPLNVAEIGAPEPEQMPATRTRGVPGWVRRLNDDDGTAHRAMVGLPVRSP